MAIAQEITITESGLSFLDWVNSLTGDAKTAALAAVADRDSKFDAQVAAGNVYFSSTGKRVWISAEAEQAHMDEVVSLYADLWAQWESETGGSLAVSVDDSPLGIDLALPFADWASQNLTEPEYTVVMAQYAEMLTHELAQTVGPLTEEEKDILRAGRAELGSALQAYNAYLAAL